MKKITFLSAVALLTFGLGVNASAQDNPTFECDGAFGACGTPDQSGGGGCGCGGGSILVNNTDLGDTYQFSDDFDDDGWEDPFDNCPRSGNLDQADGDGDGIGDACDNCLGIPNDTQIDLDGDSLGNACDDDRDGDEILNVNDNCADLPNPLVANSLLQLDTDTDGKGDACDDDIDGDGSPNLEDACPLSADITTPTGDQISLCFPDVDGDGTPDLDDLCPTSFDPNQADMDGNGIGDACDTDIDGDLILNNLDNCSLAQNIAQIDGDRDLQGDACDNNFCFVVLGDEGNCLDPAAPFNVYSPDSLGLTGTPIRLRLFANRESQAMNYTWTLVDSPKDSKASITDAKGAVTFSTPFEYHYTDGETPYFTADQPGNYTFRVVGTTAFEDRVSGTVAETAEWTMTLTVSGEPTSESDSGCTVSGVSQTAPTGAALFLLGLVGVVAIRRRR